ELKPAELPFVPRNVALHSVRLIDGTLAVHALAGGSISRVEAIGGELSAESLTGPFKFKGSATFSGVAKDIKFSTAAPDAGGSVHFKANLHGGEGSNSYLFDGQLSDFAGKPHISGELTGKLLLAASNVAEGTPAAKEAPPGFDLKTLVKADARGATFENVELDLDSAAEPQIITGKASAQWGSEPRFDAALSAKWLDLDLLTVQKGQPASFGSLKQLFVSMIEALAGEGSAGTHIEVEQAKFGGEQAGSLIVDAERSGGVVKLRQLKGGLPGGARFELAGEIKDVAGTKVFDGNGTVRGVNFARVQSFAQKSGGVLDLKAEGPFWITGHLAISDTHFALTGAKAEVGGQSVAGDVAIESGPRRKVTLRLESARLDSATFFPAEAQHISDVLNQAMGFDRAGATADASTGAGADADKLRPAETGLRPDISVRISTGELKHAGKFYRDVDATIGIEGSNLNIPAASFTTAAGVAVRASGKIQLAPASASGTAPVSGPVSGQGAAPKGSISYEIDAPGRDALLEAGELFGISQILAKPRLAALTSARIAGLVTLGKRSPGAADVTFDGLAGGARIAGEAGFDGGFKSWRTSQSHINVTSTSGDLTAVLAGLGVSPVALKGVTARPGEASVAIFGALATGAKSLAEVKADGLAVTVLGTLTATEASGYTYSGRAAIKARDAREPLALAGIAAPAGIAGTELEGGIEIASQSDGLMLSSEGLKAGTSLLKGRLTLTGAAGEVASKIGGEIATDRVAVASLLSWLTDTGIKGAAPDSGASDSGAGDAGSLVWPDASFDFTPLAELQGEVQLKTSVLELAEGLVARDGVARIVVSPGKVSIAELKARAAGGSLDLTADLHKSAAGVTLNGKLALKGELASLNPGASGRAALEFSGSGQALNPAALISSLSGKGALTLEEARHPGPAPVLVADASDAVLAGRLGNDVAVLAPALMSALGSAEVVPGTRTLPFTIARGDVKMDAYTIEGPQGSARVTTTVSLASLLVDSVWQVSAMALPLPPPPEAGPDWKPSPKGPLPPVSFVYTGPLGDTAQLQVNVEAEDLQRELGVRQMERKVEELDVLRKRDEERQRLELERRKAMEAERAQAASAAVAGAGWRRGRRIAAGDRQSRFSRAAAACHRRAPAPASSAAAAFA
ncbi:MAG: hypothetical protein ABL907_18825, partial [Hyphomicrobium sp.]